jgi:hypothetical protein
MLSAAVLAEDDDSFIARANFNGVSDEIKHIIFDSFASLDDNNVDDCFGLDIEALEAAEMYSVPKQQKIQTSSSRIHRSRSDLPPSLSFSSSSSINSKTSMTDESTKPKRPLSAYNLFFQLERERLIAGTSNTPITAEDVERVAVARRIVDELPEKPKRKHRKSHGKISFAELARAIANKWKVLDSGSKNLLVERAASEKTRFLRELEEWTKQNEIVESIMKQVPNRAQVLEHQAKKATSLQRGAANSVSFSCNGEKKYASANTTVSIGRKTSLIGENSVGDDWNAPSVDNVAFGNLSIGSSFSNDQIQNNKDFAFWQQACQSLHDERTSLQYAFLQHSASFLSHPSLHDQLHPSLQALCHHSSTYSTQDVDTFNKLHDIAFSKNATKF